MNDILATLLFPFERGLGEWPEAGQHLLFYGAQAGLDLPREFVATLTIIQDSRPDFLALQRAGFDVVPSLLTSMDGGDEGFDGALIALGRSRHENENRIAEALSKVKPGGFIMAAGSKKDGAASVAKRIGQIVTLAGQASKYHGIVFWLVRPHTLPASELSSLVTKNASTMDGFSTAVGGFSEGLVDKGSQFLLENLPDTLTGAVADFGAGWGYLSVEMARRYKLNSIDLYEAHKPSIDMAKENVERQKVAGQFEFYWFDLLNEKVERQYDAIIMNPPFHRGRAAEPDLGKAMIKVAAGALKRNGQLFLVANRGLPYEDVMAECFRSHGESNRNQVFKVLWGKK